MTQKKPKLPASRGIPAGESMWLPKHHGRAIASKSGLKKINMWHITDLVNFIFPKRYQPTYFRVASDFLRLVLMKNEIDKIDIREFLVDKNYSRSTLENKVIPKLINFGLIKKEDDLITESLTFTAYLEKVAFSWNLLVSNARNMKTYTGAGPNKLHDIRDPEL